MIRPLLAAVAGLALVAGPAAADEKMPIELKLVLKKDSYAWPYDLGPKEFEAKLQEIIKKKDGQLPKPPAVDLVLQITNKGTEKVTVYVDGDPNVFTFTLKGPGVATAVPRVAVTADLRLPKGVELEPGKSHDLAVNSLADGFRRVGRYVYPLAPGEYTLSATYQLSTRDGAKGPLLKSGEVKFKIEEPKK